MASGYKSAGTDLDSIFAAYSSSMTKAAATGYQIGGTDLNSRYAPLSYGSAASATGYKKSGADLNTIFAKLGSLIVGTFVISWGQYENVGGDGYGYGAGVVGSLVSCSLTIGGTVSQCATTVQDEGEDINTVLEITGLSSNPGQSWFATMETSLGDLSSADATYSYGGGIAQWTWDGAEYGIWEDGVAEDYTVTLVP